MTGQLTGAAYRAAYRRGWAASERYGRNSNPAAVSPLERADDRGESHAWYEGYHDHAAGRPRFHLETCADPTFHESCGL